MKIIAYLQYSENDATANMIAVPANMKVVNLS